MAAGGTGGSFSGGLPPSGQSSTSNTSAGKGPGQPQGQNPLAGTDAAGKGPGQPQIQPAQTTTVAPSGTTGIDPKLYQQLPGLNQPQVQQPYGGFPQTAGPGAPNPMLTKPGTLPPNMSPYAQQFMQGQNQLNGLGQQIGVGQVPGTGMMNPPGVRLPTGLPPPVGSKPIGGPAPMGSMPIGGPAPMDSMPIGGPAPMPHLQGYGNPPPMQPQVMPQGGQQLAPGQVAPTQAEIDRLRPMLSSPMQPQVMPQGGQQQPAQSNVPDYMRHQMQQRGMGNRMDNDRNEMQRRAGKQQSLAGLAGLNKAMQ